MGVSIFWNPQGLSRPITGIPFTFTFNLRSCVSVLGLRRTSMGRGCHKIWANTHKSFLKYCEKFQISLEILREFLSGNGQYWSNFCAQPTTSWLCSLSTFSWVGVPQNMKNYFSVPSMEKRVGKHSCIV
jgi:hypothetical protein